jgi:Holliday junction resolvasome RuvABC endonuclease subunit
MNASPNLTDPYDPMAGTLAGTAPDPWARPGAETARASAETLANAWFGGGAEAGPAPALNVNILALDLGTKLGWALQMRDRPITHGTESFAPRKSWSPGQRWQRYRTFLHEVVAHNNVHVIAYEDVKRHAGTDAAHAYGAFLALTELVADSHRVRLVPVGVGTIKKHWTGKGNADKAAMEAQARARGFRPESDNDADALAILHWAVAQERKA